MRTRFRAVAVLFCLLGSALAPARAADEYTIDGMHSAVTFKVSHVGLSWVYGRFDEFSGGFTLDPEDPGKSSFTMTIKAESVDTNNKKRDGHLCSPDFFNVKQFPTITFQSTGVQAVEGGYEVKGELTMHGVTKPIMLTLKGGRSAEFPKGVRRTGYSTELSLKRSDFGMDKMTNMIGDEVYIAISFEGTKK
jgi:polyisoprenoid-binding protein YceI